MPGERGDTRQGEIVFVYYLCLCMAASVGLMVLAFGPPTEVMLVVGVILGAIASKGAWLVCDWLGLVE